VLFSLVTFETFLRLNFTQIMSTLCFVFFYFRSRISFAFRDSHILSKKIQLKRWVTGVGKMHLVRLRLVPMATRVMCVQLVHPVVAVDVHL